ncbi:MAG: tRNA (adenosine(37)-N6)-threonylcarbamoyltransferase complex dimerization subunit type 1 TsaB [Ruminococcaceae bacterium]|nr:tRNA (adenosine(37)-N6)-threonylcarbamoyltransferase complex dimerization subunit type 1 TsaB [Oscillospiraceae bacterium]
MKILALDSSATVATVALFEDGRLLAEYTLNNGNTHSETLLPMVESVLRAYGITTDDIDLFASTSGPGSFTGVRIGTATVKGLAFGTDKPCAEVSTLEAIAENLVFVKGLICPVMNARRGQVYTALFRSDGVSLTRLMPDSAISIEELDGILAEYGETVSFAGDGYDITVRALTRTKADITPERLRHQSAASVASVAYRMAQNGETVSDTALKVTYLRPSQAERERLEAEQNKKI